MTSKPSEPNTTAARPMLQRGPVQLALIIAACALVYWPFLGTGGLTASEGHRAIPGWEMLDTGQLLVPRMFEQVYMRKPPGMPWAIAATSALLGQTELAARAVSALSATMMALFAWWFGRRWFGPRGALAAGLAQALMPWMWTVGRQAEIEALMLVGIQLGALAAVDLLRPSGRPSTRPIDRPGARPGRWSMAALACAGWTIAVFAKGPSGLPALAGAIAGAALMLGWSRAGARAAIDGLVRAIGSAGFAAALGGVWWILASRAAAGEASITQSSGAFMFRYDLDALVLVPSALIATLPAALAFTFPWGSDAVRETGDDPDAGAQLRLMRALTVACLLTAGLLAVLGVGNPRYAMPALVFAAPAVGGVAAWMAGMTRARRAIARAMCLGHPAVLTAVLIAGAWAWVFTGERTLREKSGRDAGWQLGEALAQNGDAGSAAATPSDEQAGLGETSRAAPIEIRADGVIEARPEILWYARQRASAAGTPVRVVWTPGLWQGPEPGWRGVAAVRVDPGSGEGPWARAGVDAGTLEAIYEGGVAGYEIWAVRPLGGGD